MHMRSVVLSSSDACFCFQHAKPLHTPSRARTLHVRASDPESSASSSEGTSEAANGALGASVSPIVDKAFPKTGLFSIADPKQEIYSKAGEGFDPRKKGGRFKPEFIWQTNWQEQLKRQEDLERQQAEYKRRLQAGETEVRTGPGVVSFSRLGALDDLSVDLTDQLRAARERSKQRSETVASAGTAAPAASGSRSSSQPQQRPQRQQRAAASPSYQYKDLPTKNEARRFKRSTRSAGAGSVASISAVGSMSPEEAAQRAAAAAAEQQRYELLKAEFQAWTLVLGVLGTATCYFCYTKDVAISYALGASSGLTYLRLLSRTVDAVGDQGGAAGVNTTLGQPRLLIPVVLALTYNRWNAIYADQFGYHLDFYGMLVGFFTYKLAVIGRQGWELLSDLSKGTESGSAVAGDNNGEENRDGDSAMTLDRIFISKALRE